MDSIERFFADHDSAEEDEYDDVVVEEYVEFFLHFASDDPQPVSCLLHRVGYVAMWVNSSIHLRIHSWLDTWRSLAECVQEVAEEEDVDADDEVVDDDADESEEGTSTATAPRVIQQVFFSWLEPIFAGRSLS